MMAQDPTEKLYGPDLERFRYTLVQQSRALLDRALAEADHNRGVALLEIIYEVWGLNLGALEGMACLRGVSRESRHKMLRNAVQAGKKTLLEEHRKECKGCSGSDELQEELETLN
jgi:hypothetical protein